MTQQVIGFVGFGEAAQCFAAHLAGKGGAAPLVFCEGKTIVHLIRTRSSAWRPRAGSSWSPACRL